MNWLYDAAYVFGGAFLANGVPHFVSGTLGRPLQSPFAKPHGIGLSSSSVNVIWGWANFLVAYILILHVGNFDLRATDQAIPLAAGVLGMGLITARLFGRLHGGNLIAGPGDLPPA